MGSWPWESVSSSEPTAHLRLTAHSLLQSAPLLEADTLPYGVPAVLLRRMSDGTEKPIAYASRSLCQPSVIIHGWSRRPYLSSLWLPSTSNICLVATSLFYLTTNHSAIFLVQTNQIRSWLQLAFRDGHYYSVPKTKVSATDPAKLTPTWKNSASCHLRHCTIVGMFASITAQGFQYTPQNWRWRLLWMHRTDS